MVEVFAVETSVRGQPSEETPAQVRLTDEMIIRHRVKRRLPDSIARMLGSGSIL